MEEVTLNLLSATSLDPLAVDPQQTSVSISTRGRRILSSPDSNRLSQATLLMDCVHKAAQLPCSSPKRQCLILSSGSVSLAVGRINSDSKLNRKRQAKIIFASRGAG